MSSLRISQHRAAIGASAGAGGNAHAEAAGDGASFAGALDAAGAGPRGPSSPGGTAGDASGDQPSSRKRGEQAVTSADVAALADIAGTSLGALTSAAANATSSGSGALSPTLVATGLAASTGGDRSVLSGQSFSVDSTSGDNAAAVAPDALASPPAAALAAAATGGSEVAGSAAGSTDRLGTPVAMQRNSDPTAASLPDKAVTAAASAASVSSALMVGASEIRTSSEQTTDVGRVVPPGIADMAETTLVASNPARAGTASASMPPSGSGGSLPFAVDPAAGLPAGLVSSTSGGASAGITADPLPALGPVPAPSALVAEAQLPVALASAGDTTRDDRGRLQPFRTAFDGGIAPTAAVAAPAAGAEAPPGAVTTSPAPAPELASPGGVSDQVAAHLVRLVSSGSRDMVMRLRPPELGDVTVRVAVTGRDVSAWFASPQPQVQNAITAAIGQLQTTLGDAGYNLSGAWVGGGAADAQQERSSPPTPAASRVLSAAAAIPSGAAAQIPAASGLNIYV
jgi:hypothetical protein